MGCGARTDLQRGGGDGGLDPDSATVDSPCRPGMHAFVYEGPSFFALNSAVAADYRGGDLRVLFGDSADLGGPPMASLFPREGEAVHVPVPNPSTSLWFFASHGTVYTGAPSLEDRAVILQAFDWHERRPLQVLELPLPSHLADLSVVIWRVRRLGPSAYAAHFVNPYEHGREARVVHLVHWSLTADGEAWRVQARTVDLPPCHLQPWLDLEGTEEAFVASCFHEGTDGELALYMVRIESSGAMESTVERTGLPNLYDDWTQAFFEERTVPTALGPVTVGSPLTTGRDRSLHVILRTDEGWQRHTVVDLPVLDVEEASGPYHHLHVDADPDAERIAVAVTEWTNRRWNPTRHYRVLVVDLSPLPERPPRVETLLDRFHDPHRAAGPAPPPWDRTQEIISLALEPGGSHVWMGVQQRGRPNERGEPVQDLLGVDLCIP
ncbi:MAG: hypothetical protein ACFCGT_21030 [Sandaracinaceae bacterium]